MTPEAVLEESVFFVVSDVFSAVFVVVCVDAAAAAVTVLMLLFAI